jgi:hypothetical protein
MKSFSILAPALAASALVLTAGHLAAQDEADKKEALDLYKKAVAYADKEQWQAALDLFRQSAKLGAPDVVHYNIGRCLERLGKFEEAAASYVKYLESPSATDVKEVEETVKRLYEKPSMLFIRSDPEGAAVIMKTDDGERKVGETPFETELQAGKHVIMLRKKGYKGKILKINAGYGKRLHIKAELEPEPGGGAEPDDSAGGARKQRGGSGRAHLGLVLQAGGGLSLHLYRGMDARAGGAFDVEINKIFTLGSLGLSAGARVNGSFYAIADTEGHEYEAMFVDALAQVRLGIGLVKRLTLVAAIPLGASFLAPTEKIPNVELKLLGGRLEGGSFPFFAFGAAVGLRVDIVAGLHLLVRPADVIVLVPLKETYGSGKVFPRYAANLLLGWEF